MKRSLCMSVSFMMGMNFCAYAMESERELRPLFASATLRAIDEAYKKGDNALVQATKQAYSLRLSKQPTCKFAVSEDANEIDLTNQKFVTLGSLHDDGHCTIFHTNPIAAIYIHSIDVSDNQLSELPLQQITNLCTFLQKFKACRNNVSYVSMHGYNKQNSLTELDLSHNQFIDIHLPDLLNAYPALQTLRLSHNPLAKVDWHTPWERAESTLYPDIHLDNTLLSMQERSKLVERYKSVLTCPIRIKFILPTVVASGLGVLIGELAVLISTGKVYTSGELAGGMVGAGVSGGTLTACAIYLWCRSELQRLKQEAEKHVIFDELYEVRDDK